MLSFLRNLFHSLWIFFPGFLFLLLSLLAFWNLSQGKDLMLLATQQSGFFFKFILILLLVVIVAWYGSRIISDMKCHRDENYLPASFRKHIPRILGFSFFTIILLAFLQTSLFSPIHISNWKTRPYYLLLALSFPYYFLLVNFFERRFRTIRINFLFYITLILIIVTTLLCSFSIENNKFLVIVNLLVLQASFLIFVVTRREYQVRIKEKGVEPIHLHSRLLKNISDKLEIPESERIFLLVFLVVSALGFLLYLKCTFSIRTAIWMGSFSFVLLAFSIFMGFGFMVSAATIKTGLNFHFLLILIAFTFGLWTERHQAALITKKANHDSVFSHRMDLKSYFTKWVDDRRLLIAGKKDFPVYFVLSDGGASRSGYWVASVLSHLQDTTRAQFANHLFCLSGASGGSVGNAAFFMLLKKYHQKIDSAAGEPPYLPVCKEYLKSDFLAYTLSRMLGHDLFVQLSPFDSRGDRAAALSQSLEEGAEDSTISLSTPMSNLVATATSANTALPVLFINSTRMQDGKPSVIGTIQVDTAHFNSRLDVLNLLDSEKDMKLSTAVVLGASFPYVCPAGRIDQQFPGAKNGTKAHYFVDGGYVDNSGAGVVHEMLIQLNKWKWDNSKDSNYSRLRFIVIHISNGPSGESLIQKVNPFINDLAAPLKTLAGSYSIQTSINDKRLENYIKYSDSFKNYWSINLYREKEPLTYPMNWVISKRTLDSMDYRLGHHGDLDNLVAQMKDFGVPLK